MGRKKVTTPEPVEVFVAPDAPRAVVVRGGYQGDFVFLLNDVQVDYIDLPEGFIDTLEEIEDGRKTVDQLIGIKAMVAEDQRDDLMYLIDILMAEIHEAEAWHADFEAELAKTMAAEAKKPNRDALGRFTQAS